MRDKLIHYYFGVDLEVIWDVVKNKLQTIRTQIEWLIREID